MIQNTIFDTKLTPMSLLPVRQQSPVGGSRRLQQQRQVSLSFYDTYWVQSCVE